MARQHGLALGIFSGLSTSYDSVVDLMTLRQDRAWKRRMLDRLRVPQGARVLDVGCGTGVLEEAYSLRESEVVGVDLTGDMLRVAHRKLLRPVSMLGLADAERLPFANESFDFVVSCYVAKYCNTKRFVDELARVLRPGGRMAVYDFTTPEGPLSPPLHLYIYGVIPILGSLLARQDPSLAFTCRALPGLIRSTRWKEELEQRLRERGFVGVEHEALTSGVVTVFWASKA